MRTVFLSDSHGEHEEVVLPEGDLLVHAGDFSRRGGEAETRDFLRWFASRPHRHKVFVAGNHDFLAERQAELFRSMVPAGCVYLNDSGVELGGLKIWGSPVTPWFFDWAFNRERGPEIRRHWDLIPAGLDILITHGPPAGILDQVVRGERVGCADLAAAIRERKPRVHVFGHIHEAYGQHEQDGVRYLNASVLDVRCDLRNTPIVIDL